MIYLIQLGICIFLFILLALHRKTIDYQKRTIECQKQAIDNFKEIIKDKDEVINSQCENIVLRKKLVKEWVRLGYLKVPEGYDLNNYKDKELDDESENWQEVFE